MTTTGIGPSDTFDPTGGLDSRRVSIGELDLSVLEAGAGGLPLLLVHGFTGAKEDFGVEVARFAELGFHAVAPDHRGHGDSDHPGHEDAYSFDAFALDMIGLADVLEWERFDVIGHSMGGMIVQHLVAREPHRVGRMILMDTHHGPVADLDTEMLELGVQLARTEGMAVIQEVLRAGADPLANPAHQRLCAEVPGYEEWCDDKFLAASPSMFASMLRRFHETPDRLEELRSLRCETLVVVGELDRPFLGASRRMTDAIAGAELAVIPGAGHSPQMEATEAWRAAVDAFLLRGR